MDQAQVSSVLLTKTKVKEKKSKLNLRTRLIVIQMCLIKTNTNHLLSCIEVVVRTSLKITIKAIVVINTWLRANKL